MMTPAQTAAAALCSEVAALFVGRELLRVGEVANWLQVDDKHVRNLIDAHHITHGVTGLGAVNIASGRRVASTPHGNLSRRYLWRIPLAEFLRFIETRACA